MRLIRRTTSTEPVPAAPRGFARAVALIVLADALVGASFGAVTTGAGLPVWLPVLLSVVVFAGAAQLAFVAVLVAGGGPAAAVATGLLLNARLAPLSYAVSDLLGPGRVRRLLGAHLVTDESAAVAVAQTAADARRGAFWWCGGALFVAWNVGVAGGAYAGEAVGDTSRLGLDAAFPALLLALVAPALADPRTRLVAVAGTGIALATVAVVPAGLPVVLALLGLLLLGRTTAAGRPTPGPAAP